MRCDKAGKLLDGFRTGELSRREHAGVASHLAGCLACARALDNIEALATDLLRLRVASPLEVLAHVQEKTADRYAAVHTDLGRLWVGFHARGVTMIDPSGGDAKTFADRYQKRFGRRPLEGELPESDADAVKKAAAGISPASVRVDLSRLTCFEQTILRLLRHIPCGEVRPYSWLAREAGRPRAVRAVGNTMARNPVPLLLPCHRVVPTAGGIGKYAFGTPLKRTLLMREGVAVDEIEKYEREGVRYLGSRSTNIYCFPTCRDARRVQLRNRVMLASIAEASAAGFRPCRHCRPQ